jgi:hypothetical protein
MTTTTDYKTQMYDIKKQLFGSSYMMNLVFGKILTPAGIETLNNCEIIALIMKLKEQEITFKDKVTDLVMGIVINDKNITSENIKDFINSL